MVYIYHWYVFCLLGMCWFDNASRSSQQPLPVVGLDKSIMILNTGFCLISIGDLAVPMILVFITFMLARPAVMKSLVGSC